MTSPRVEASQARYCARCQTECAERALACPACGALLYADRLRALAARAEAAVDAGRTVEGRDAWQQALELLPPNAQQYEVVSGKISVLNEQILKTPAINVSRDPAAGRIKQGWMAVVAVAALLLGKAKFLLLGLSKAKTLLSMGVFFSFYWNTYGWPLALGLVVSIYIHEMGHVFELRRMGIGAGAPLFIPGVGAVIRLRQQISDPVVDARIGLAGPVWGLGAGLVALGAYALTREPTWKAIAQLTGFLNLFNLIPVWQLDGARGFHALSRVQRWAVVGVSGLAYVVTRQPMLLAVGAVGVFRAWRPTEVKGHAPTLGMFVLLVLALSALSWGMSAQ